MNVRVTHHNPMVEIQTEIRRGMLAAGDLILATSDAQAPREDGAPRHGVHMTETGFRRVEVGLGLGDRLAVGYAAFWARWQHERMNYKHKHGRAKFLELAFLEMHSAAMALIAASVRRGGVG